MKMYTIGIESPNGVTVSIAYYRDTPDKNYRIYYCGSDTGLRYDRIGNASKRLEQYLRDWAMHGVYGRIKMGTVHDIPIR